MLKEYEEEETWLTFVGHGSQIGRVSIDEQLHEHDAMYGDLEATAVDPLQQVVAELAQVGALHVGVLVGEVLLEP